VLINSFSSIVEAFKSLKRAACSRKTNQIKLRKVISKIKSSMSNLILSGSQASYESSASSSFFDDDEEKNKKQLTQAKMPKSPTKKKKKGRKPKKPEDDPLRMYLDLS